MSENKNNPKEVHIFLDLDGVLADFETHAKAENKYEEDGQTLKWDELDYQWWSTIPVFEGAKAFYDEVIKMGVTKFLTAPVLTEGAFSGKAHWVKNFVPEKDKWILKDLIICPSADKAYLARANHILIDDRILNVKDWIKAGGIGIHHKGDFGETWKKLEDAISRLNRTSNDNRVNKKQPKIGGK